MANAKAQKREADQHADNPKASPDPNSNQIKDPDDWVTGDEPMTGAQASYLETLARQIGEDVPADLTKAEASQRIDELRANAGMQHREGDTTSGS